MDVAVVDIVVAGTVLHMCGVAFMVAFGLSVIQTQLGYLHLSKAPFMCSTSLCNS